MIVIRDNGDIYLLETETVGHRHR